MVCLGLCLGDKREGEPGGRGEVGNCKAIPCGEQAIEGRDAWAATVLLLGE